MESITDAPNWHVSHIRAHEPRLHSCEICSYHAGGVIIGHHESWCWKKRKLLQTVDQEIEEISVPDNSTARVESSVHKQTGNLHPLRNPQVKKGTVK